MNNIMQMLSNLSKLGNNPNQIIQNMVMQNPNAKALLQQMQNSGMSAQDFAKQYARQNNIDLDKIVNTARSMGIKL